LQKRRVHVLVVAMGLLLSGPFSAHAEQALAPAAAQPWHAGYFPNVILTDHDGRRHRFYDDLIKNKVFAINFIYTKCVDVCPAETAQLRQVQDLLGDRLGKDVFIYSISIDPKNDTPVVLKRYRHMFGVAKGWSFFTGKLGDVELLQKKLGLKVVLPAAVKDHATSVMFGNEKSATWIKRSPYDEPKVLAGLLTERLQNHATGAGGRASYDTARQAGHQSKGEILFRSRCASCHTIGGGDRLGPDLANVVPTRPRPWLVRWLKEPDKMIAEGDPVALELKARYRNLPMPNFSFGDVEANALIEYMSERDAKRKGTSPPVKPN